MPQSDHIFLSYARADRATAAAVVEALRGAGLAVWWDADIPLGPTWQGVLQEKLGECGAFLVLVGGQGVSGWVSAEVAVALSRHFDRGASGRMPIVPVLLGDAPDVHVPPFLALFQQHRLADARDPAGIAALASALRDGAFRAYPRPVLPPELRRCPFPGLAPYERHHRSLFLGRHTDLLEALERFGRARIDGGRPRWLRIEGNSGVGKSSLLRAGLIPALESGWLDLGASDAALRILGVMRPGHEPMVTLAGVLAKAFGLQAEDVEQRLWKPEFRLKHLLVTHMQDAGQRQLPLLVVDQLEELFTLSREDGAERERFDRLVAEATDDPDLPLYLVTTMRSDFAGLFEAAPALAARRRPSAQYELLPVGESGLRDILVRSVDLAGLHYSDDQLPEDILDEARGERGALPLVSNLLRLLCDRGPEGELRREDHRTLGGLGGALASSADALLDGLGAGNRERALGLLLALVEPGAGTANTRRSISRRRAVESAGGGARGEDILRRLSGHPGTAASPRESNPMRLVLVAPSASGDGGEDTVDLIHETLLRTDPKGRPYWPALWERIEHTDFLETRARLEAQARAWQRMPDTVPLARGRELRVFEAHRPGADADGLAYLDASRAARRRQHRTAGVVMLSVVLLAGFLGEGAWWLYRQQASPETEFADWSTLVARWRVLAGVPALPDLVPMPPEGASPCFRMDSPEGTGQSNERPQHEVCLDEFHISRHEVTFTQYDAFAVDRARPMPGDQGWGRGARPVINVAWQEARDYAAWVSQRVGLACTLPSEAQWEYAARAGTGTPWHWGEDEAAAGDYAWFVHNSDDRTHPVGEKAPNPFGLHDTAGNVWEWTEDCYGDSYAGASRDGGARRPEDGNECSVRVLRGGAWGYDPDGLRSGYRGGGRPGGRSGSIGFRLVCRPPSSSNDP